MGCLPYALNLPISVGITDLSGMKILEPALEAARTLRKMSQSQVQSLVAFKSSRAD